MPNFYYLCPSCGHKYHEFRAPEHSQFVTHCVVCKTVEYVETEE